MAACSRRRRTTRRIHKPSTSSGLPPPDPSEHPPSSWPLSTPLRLLRRLLGFCSIPTSVRRGRIRGLGSGKAGLEHSTTSLATCLRIPSRNGFSFVPATEAFPLILSIGIVVQGITFAVAQSTGLDSLFGSGCTLIAVFMFPGKLIWRQMSVIYSDNSQLFSSFHISS